LGVDVESKKSIHSSVLFEFLLKVFCSKRTTSNKIGAR
jgi:hypothetical protein